MRIALLLAAFILVTSGTSATALIVELPSAPNTYFVNPFGQIPDDYPNSAEEYQQIYSAGDFSGPIAIQSLTFYSLLCQIAEEGPIFNNGVFALALSTTKATVGGLSSNLASNFGPDLTPVFFGSLPNVSAPLSVIFPDLNVCPQNFYPFTLTFDLQTTFNYDPSQGNLLLNVLEVGATEGAAFGLDGSLGPSDFSLAIDTDLGFDAYDGGLTTGFNESGVVGVANFVAGPPVFPPPPPPPPPPPIPDPEPTSLVLFLSGLLGLVVYRCKRRPNTTVSVAAQ